MIRKFLIIFAVALCVTVIPAFAVQIESISATNAGTSFVGGVGGELTMNGVGGINVQYASGTVTYGSGQFNLNTNLSSVDVLSGGIVRGNFTGGAFSYKDVLDTTLLLGSIETLNLTETYNGSGMFWGEGYFIVTGGTLQLDFGANGKMVDISYSITPNTINNFSSPGFTGSSNMTVLPVPEPATICLLGLGVFSLIRRKKRRGNLLLSIKQKRGTEK